MTTQEHFYLVFLLLSPEHLAQCLDNTAGIKSREEMETTDSSFRLLMAKIDDSHCCWAAYKISPKHLSNTIHGEKPEDMTGKIPLSCNRVRWLYNIDATEHERTVAPQK